MSTDAAHASFVGRASELHLAETSRRQVEQGSGSLLLVTGESGIGKTRFCEEVAARARAAGLPAAWGRCWAEGGAPPLWPWHGILRELCGADAADILEGDSGSDAVDPERFARFSAVVDRLQQRCRDQPALVVIDDAHGADAGAVLLTRFIARSLHALPLLMLVTRRSGEPEAGTTVDRLLGELARDAHAVSLHGLDATDTRAFVATLGVEAGSAADVTALLRLTGGNPLFLQEVVANAGSASSTAGPSPLVGGLLPGVRHAMEDRLTRLDDEDRHVLAMAAVLGTEPHVGELAALAEREPAAVLAAAERAATLGIVAVDDSDHLVFQHELVRDALLGALSPTERLDAHARAADVISGPAGRLDAVARRAHHACAAALRSPADARTAVAASRVAADAMVRGFAYEEGAALLATAVDIARQADLDGPRAPLLVERAELVLLCGRLAESRGLFDEAARVADEEDDPISRARAAIGMGGVWVNEHRSPDEQARMLALQERARAALPAEEVALRLRLDARLAAEAVYAGGSPDAVRAVVEEARQLGDGRVLAEALSLWHHSLLAPEHAAVRLPIAEELTAVASAAGAGLLALMGLCWSAVDLFLVGDNYAERALEDFRARADALASQSLRYVVDVLDVMQAIRAGRFVEAEAAAEECLRLGVEVGDADAIAYYGAHLVAIRWAQGRAGEILPLVEELAASPTLPFGDEVYPAAVAGLAAAAGDLERARPALDQVTAFGLTFIPPSSTWLTAMLSIVEAAYALDDAAVAAEAYDLLVPFAALPIMPSLAVACFGSTERLLGLAAATTGRVDDAIGHLDRAARENQRLGNQPLVAITHADLATSLVTRGGDGDAERARGLFERAIASGRSMGLDGRVARWQRQLDEVAAPRSIHPPAPGPAIAPEAGVFRPAGSHWVVAAHGREIVVPDSVGMAHLRRLVAQPGVSFSAAELSGGGEVVAPPSVQPLIDDQARGAYKQRVIELQAEIDEADAYADLERSTNARVELDALVDELTRSTAIAGRDRAFPTSSERARTSVRKAIKRAIDRITSEDAAIGALFEQSVTTGTACRYDPVPDGPQRWITS